jgi:hypothetical protein
MAENIDSLRMVDLAVIDSAASIDDLRSVNLVMIDSSDAANMESVELIHSQAKERDLAFGKDVDWETMVTRFEERTAVWSILGWNMP